MPADDVLKARELFALDLSEVSLVDVPAVPKAKILLMKRQGDPSYDGIAKAAAEVETTLGALSGELKVTKVWDTLPSSVRVDLEKSLRKAHIVAKAAGAVEGVTKYYDDYYYGNPTDAEKDAYLLSDINWASSMLISVKSMFDELGNRLDDNDFAKGLIGTINGSTLASLKDVAAVMVSAVEGIETKIAEAPDPPADDQRETTTKADDGEPEDAVADDTTPDEPTNADILAAITTLAVKVESNTDRLTILEPDQTDDDVDATPKPEVEETPEPAATTPAEEGLPDGVLTVAQIQEGMLLVDTMTPDEAASFQAAVQATADAIGLDTASVEAEGGDVPPVVDAQVEQPAV